jgi:hypothetical protein
VALKVYDARNAIEAGTIASTLSSEGIKCEVRDSVTSLYEPIAVIATVWIFNDSDSDRARAIVADTDRIFSGKRR